MISPWTIYKQQKDYPSIGQSKELKNKKINSSSKSKIHNLQSSEVRNQFANDEVFHPFSSLQDESSLSSSFLSRLESSIKTNKNQHYPLNQQIQIKRNQVLKNIDTLALLKSIAHSLDNDSKNIIQMQQKSKRSFRPINNLTFQENPEINPNKRLINKLLNIQKSHSRLNHNQTQHLTSIHPQKIDSQFLAQKFIYKGQNIQIYKEDKLKKSIKDLQIYEKEKSQQLQSQNSKSKKKSSPMKEPHQSSKNIKNLIYQILKRHINFDKSPKLQNHPIEMPENIHNQQNKNTNRSSQKPQISFQSSKQLLSLRQICLLKRNRKTLSFVDQKISKNILKFSELKSRQKELKNQNEKQKSKKIKITLQKIEPKDKFFTKTPSNSKEQSKKQQKSFSLSRMNNSQMKFGDQKIFSKIKYTTPNNLSKNMLQQV